MMSSSAPARSEETSILHRCFHTSSSRIRRIKRRPRFAPLLSLGGRARRETKTITMITSNARYAPDGPAKRPSCVRSPRGRHPCPRCVRWCSQRRELHPCSTPGLRDADVSRRPLPQKKTLMTLSSSARAPTREDSGGGATTPSTPRRATDDDDDAGRRRRSADASFSSFGYKRHSSLKRRGGGRQILYLFFLVFSV